MEEKYSHGKMNEAEGHSDEPEFEDSDSKWKGPIKVMIGLFLLLIVVAWLVPYYGVKLNPEPNKAVGLEEIQIKFLKGVDTNGYNATNNIREAAARIKADDPIVRQAAAAISTQSCAESKICHAKALYYFVRDNIQYVSDPDGKEYIAPAVETLKTGGGDCDDGAILLANLLEAVGIKSEIVVVPGHAMVKAAIPELPPKYLIDGWAYMDWTCSGCSFGEIPYQYVPQLSD